MIEGFSDFDLGMVGLGGWEIGLFEEDEKKKYFSSFCFYCSVLRFFLSFSPLFLFALTSIYSSDRQCEQAYMNFQIHQL
jgi:hypothetical protein